MCNENEENKEKYDCSLFFVLKKVKFDRRLQKPIGTDQYETNSNKALHNKGIHTIVIT